MRDRPRCFEPAVLRGLLAVVVCLVWASGLHAANAGFFSIADGLLDPAAAAKAGQIASEKSIGGTLQVVVGFNGTVRYNEGAGWRNLPDPGGYPSSEHLYRVRALGLDNLWVGTQNGARFFDGTGWSPLELAGQVIFDLMVAPDGVVACNFSNGVVWRRAGSGWESIGSFPGVDIRGIWGMSTDDFWICGSGGFIRRYRHGEWETITSHTSQTLNAVWGAPEVGPFFVGNSATLREYRNGAIHQISTTGITQHMYGIDGTSGSNIWISGSAGRVWFYNGAGISAAHHPGGTANDYWAVNALPSGLVTVAGQTGSVWHYDGTTWTANNVAGAPFLVGMVSLPAQDNAGWWDGFARAPRGLGLTTGTEAGRITTLLEHGGRLYAHGNFSAAGAEPLQHIAAFADGRWHAVPECGPASSALGRTLTVYQGDLVASVQEGSQVLIKRLVGGAWQTMGTTPTGSVLNIQAMTFASQQRLFIAGTLTDGGQRAVFEWHPGSGTWQPVGSGLPSQGFIYHMIEFGGDLYVALFGHSRVMRLAGANPAGTWTEVFFSTTMQPIGLHQHGDQLYVGCAGTDIDALRRYVPGGSEEWVGQQCVINGYGLLTNMASDGDRIYLTGYILNGFVEAASRNVAYFEPQSGELHAMGTGLNYEGTCVAVFGGDLFVGGYYFSKAGSCESYAIARWRDPAEAGDMTPVASVGAPAAITPGQEAGFTAEVASYQTVRSVTLSYRTLDRDDFRHIVMQQPSGGGQGSFQATIPAIHASLHGLQYFVTAQTDQATVTVPPNAGVAAGYVGAAISRTRTLNLAARQYELIGIPFQPAGTMSQIFEGELGSYDPAQWRLERWNPVAGSYRSFRQVEPAAPGRGYYIIQSSPRNLTITGTTTSTVNGLSITLAPGWNMIAAPYLFNIPWNQVIRPAGVEAVFYGRVDDEYVEYEGVSPLQPWSGYFLYYDSDVGGEDTVDLIVPANPPGKMVVATTDAAASEVAPAERPGCDWLVTITPSQGSRQDLIKTIGAVTLGTGGPGNLRQPPSLEHDLSVWLELEQDGRTHLLRRDLRTLDSGAVWDLVIRPAADEHGPVRLAFAGLENVPADLEVALATPQGVVDLRQTGGLWQGAAAGQTRLRLVIGDPELIEQAAGTLPQPYALLPAYPNPSNPMTTVAFTLPREGRVRVDLYDVAGRRVRTLVDEVRGPGRHAVEWDGTDDRGRGLSSGVYLMRLQAGDFSQTQKLTLVR